MLKVGKIFALICLLSLFSCDTENDRRLVFLGDSLVARWDLEVSFPSYVVENKGISGSGIDSFSKYKNQYIGTDIVVIIGTNDLGKITDDNILEYTKSYLEQIVSTGAENIYLFSILPRNFANDSVDINDKIERLNELIKSGAENYGNIIYIDAYSYLANNEGIAPQYSYDGLHMSLYGYEKLSQLLISNLK